MSMIPPALAARAVEMTQNNPANPPERKARARVSMALPTLKLKTPKIPGFELHWFRGTSARLAQAQAAGYRFVTQSEVDLPETGLANDAEGVGNSSLGDHVSVSAGDELADGQGARLFLMKIPKEFWDEDQLAVDQKHEQTAAILRGDKGYSEAGQDSSNRYSRGEQRRNMFQPRRP